MREPSLMKEVSSRKPYFDKIIVQGLFLNETLEFKPNAPRERVLAELKRLTEKILVWTKCPKCGLDVPQIDMTIQNCCYFCFQEIPEEVRVCGRVERKGEKMK